MVIPRSKSALCSGLLLLSCVSFQAASAAPAGSGAVSQGDVLFCDFGGTYGLAAYSPSTGATIAVATGGLIPRPTGLAVETASSALVTTIQPGRVVRVDLDTGQQTLVAEEGLMGTNPDGITMGLNGRAYVASLVDARIVELDLITGVQRSVTSGGFLASPIFLAPTGPNTLIATSNNGRIVEIDIANGTQRMASSGGFLVTPQGIAVLPDDDVLVADYGAASLIRINPVTGSQTIVASGISDAWGVSLDGLGQAYVSRYVASTAGLVRVDLLTGGKTTLTTPPVTAFGIQVFQPSTEPPPPPPATPGDFTASDEDPTGVALSWTAVPDAYAYWILRDGVVATSLLAGETSWFDTPPVGSYEYCIVAYNRGGNSEPACDPGTRRDYFRQPVVSFVRDVAGDQGGQVAIAWLASEMDVSVNRIITGYRVWRRLMMPQAGAPSLAGTDAMTGTGIRSRAVNGEIEYWEPILTIPAAYREGYGAVVATTRDSLPDSNPYTAFFVSALTADPFVFHDSAVDSGYSVDNLAPPAPSMLAGAYESSGAVRLSWRRPPVLDLRDFRVFRGPSRDIDPAHDVLLGSTPDTTFTDAGGGLHYYKVVAVDIHGNQGAPAVLSPLDIPTPAWVLGASGDWQEGSLTIEVRLVSDYRWNRAIVLRSESPDLESAVVVDGELAPSEPGVFRHVETDAPASGALWYWMRVSDSDGRLALAGPVVVEPSALLARTAALHPVPNPARDAMAIAFVVGTELGGGAVPVRARIVDAAGRRVRDLNLGPVAPGRHQLAWDRRDGRGTRVAAGIYRVLIRIGGHSFARSVVVF